MRFLFALEIFTTDVMGPRREIRSLEMKGGPASAGHWAAPLCDNLRATMQVTQVLRRDRVYK